MERKQMGEPVAWMFTGNDGHKHFSYSKQTPEHKPLYTHADAGEVERLREDLATVKADRDAYAQNAIDLRAKLAERDALLRGLIEYADGLLYDCNRAWSRAGRCADDDVHEDADYLKAVKLLSASAEPSAPVERDSLELLTELMDEAKAIVESKFVYKRFIRGTPLSNDIPVWMVEFARAALERKP